MSGQVLKPGADQIWQENIRVPQVPLTLHGNCHIINVKYEIEVSDSSFETNAVDIGTCVIELVFFS